MKYPNGSGGALAISKHGNVTVRFSEYCSNKSTLHGGAIGSNGNIIISHSLLSDNSARNGGAIASYKALRIHDAKILRNTAEYGGAVACTGGEMTIDCSSLRDNNARQSGGAIYNYSTATVRRTSFCGNQAGANGGAIEHAGRFPLSIINSTLSGNVAAIAGGGMLLSKGTATLTHVSISNNSSQAGGGISCENGQLLIINSIIAGNKGGDCKGSLYQNVKNLIQDGSGNPALSDDPMLGPLTGDPAFHPLQLGSPAIDAAHPDYHEPVDQRGTPRPQGGGLDIGAIEYAPED